MAHCLQGINCNKSVGSSRRERIAEIVLVGHFSSVLTGSCGNFLLLFYPNFSNM